MKSTEEGRSHDQQRNNLPALQRKTLPPIPSVHLIFLGHTSANTGSTIVSRNCSSSHHIHSLRMWGKVSHKFFGGQLWLNKLVLLTLIDSRSSLTLILILILTSQISESNFLILAAALSFSIAAARDVDPSVVLHRTCLRLSLFLHSSTPLRRYTSSNLSS